MLKQYAKGKTHTLENVRYELRDKNGNVKPMFQENALFRFLLKHGIVSPYAPKVPYLLGTWGTAKVLSNLVVNAGLAGTASRINGAGAEAAFTYIAIGIGTVAPAAGDTTLGSEITTGGGARANATASRVTTTVTNDTARLVHTFSFTAGFAVTESGVLNAASTGTLLARQTFSAINVASGDSLQVTWDFKVTTA